VELLIEYPKSEIRNPKIPPESSHEDHPYSDAADGPERGRGHHRRWRKKVGDAVAADEVIMDVESDKITVEVESPGAGSARQPA
jgi:biotin carboxyl carrier protein